jgi:hypothetical protein
LQRNKEYFALESQMGKFTRKQADLVWSEHKEEDREVFINFMLSCEICFSTEESGTKNELYIIPQLLPENMPSYIATRWEQEEETLYYRYQFDFIHSAVIWRFIVRTHSFSATQDFWQKGIEIQFGSAQALVLFNASAKQINIQLRGSQTKTLLDKIRNELDKIQQSVDLQDLVAFDGETWVNLQTLDFAISNKESQVITTNNQVVSIADYQAYLSVDKSNQFKEQQLREPERGRQEESVLKERKNEIPISDKLKSLLLKREKYSEVLKQLSEYGKSDKEALEDVNSLESELKKVKRKEIRGTSTDLDAEYNQFREKIMKLIDLMNEDGFLK